MIKPGFMRWWCGFNKHTLSTLRYNLREMFCWYPKEFLQRGARGWSNNDVIGFYDYLSDVMIGGIKHLKDNHMAHPCWCEEPWNSKRECHCDDKWHVILQEIIEGLQAGERISNLNYEEFDLAYEKLQKGEGYDPDKEKVRVLMDADQERFDHAMDLLKKHFFSLWD